MLKQIYILLPVFNRKETTDRFLNQIEMQTYRNWKVLVLDDGSSDGTSQMIREKYPDVEVFRGGGLWWAGSLQFLINELRKRNPDPGSLVLIINDDVEIPENYLEKAVQILSRHSSSFLGSVQKSDLGVDYDEYGVVFDLKALRLRAGKPGEAINCLPTRGLFLHWDDFSKIGEFHPKLLPHYFSDYEFSIRAFQKGFDFILDREVWVRTSGRDSGMKLKSEAGVFPTLKYVFSNLNRMNPIHFSLLILMRCPGVYKLLHQRTVLAGVYQDLEIGLKKWQFFPVKALYVTLRIPFRSIKWTVRLGICVVRKFYRILTGKKNQIKS